MQEFESEKSPVSIATPVSPIVSQARNIGINSDMEAMLAKPMRQFQNFEDSAPNAAFLDNSNVEIDSILSSVLPTEITEPTVSASLENARPANRHYEQSPTSATLLMPSSLFQFAETSHALDIDFNMRTMDRIFRATFRDFVQNEKNVMSIARRMIVMSDEYSPYLIASALRFIISGWSLESVAKLLKLSSRDWSPETSGMVLNLITIGWNCVDIQSEDSPTLGRSTFILYPEDSGDVFVKFAQDHSGNSWPALSKHSKNCQMKLVAILSAGESPEMIATFIKSLTRTENWTPARVTELVSFLDTILEWDDMGFRKFTQHYIMLINGELNSNSSSPSKPTTGKISFEYLSALYKTNLALANYKLALGEFKVALESRAPQVILLKEMETVTGRSSMQPLLCAHEESTANCVECRIQINATYLVSRRSSVHVSDSWSVHESQPSVWSGDDLTLQHNQEALIISPEDQVTQMAGSVGDLQKASLADDLD